MVANDMGFANLLAKLRLKWRLSAKNVLAPTTKPISLAWASVNNLVPNFFQGQKTPAVFP